MLNNRVTDLSSFGDKNTNAELENRGKAKGNNSSIFPEKLLQFTNNKEKRHRKERPSIYWMDMTKIKYYFVFIDSL